MNEAGYFSMKPLRIGNLIRARKQDSANFRTNVTMDTNIFMQMIQGDIIWEPIPLDPEYLLALGFFCENKDGFPLMFTTHVQPKGMGYYFILELSEEETITFTYSRDGWQYIRLFTTVHDLQNFFFALTETELNFDQGKLYNL
jgi:hypothetical protein